MTERTGYGIKRKAPYKSHRSNVGYRGLLHRIFGGELVIPRNAFGTRQERLTPISHKIGRPRKREVNNANS